MNKVQMEFYISSKLWSKEEIFSKPSPVPKSPGVYAWFFKNIPSIIPLDGCKRHDNLPLLYVGISPKSEPENGAPASRQRLFHRIRSHYNGSAEGSTLRLTLGVLLQDTLDIELRRVGNGKRMTFGEGEKKLSMWMEENAFVKWTVIDEPWLLKEEIIKRLSLPFNLGQNQKHSFHDILSVLRKDAKLKARELPILSK